MKPNERVAEPSSHCGRAARQRSQGFDPVAHARQPLAEDEPCHDPKVRVEHRLRVAAQEVIPLSQLVAVAPPAERCHSGAWVPEVGHGMAQIFQFQRKMPGVQAQHPWAVGPPVWPCGWVAAVTEHSFSECAPTLGYVKPPDGTACPALTTVATA